MKPFKPKPINGANLLKEYIQFFNKYRNAGIEAIGNPEDARINTIVVRYHTHEIELPDDVLTWVNLFDRLSELHPRKPHPAEIRYPCTKTTTKRASGGSTD